MSLNTYSARNILKLLIIISNFFFPLLFCFQTRNICFYLPELNTENLKTLAKKPI